MISSSSTIWTDTSPPAGCRSLREHCATGTCPSAPTASWRSSARRAMRTTPCGFITPTARWARCAETARGASAATAMSTVLPEGRSAWKRRRASSPASASTAAATASACPTLRCSGRITRWSLTGRALTAPMSSSGGRASRTRSSPTPVCKMPTSRRFSASGARFAITRRSRAARTSISMS